MSCNEDSKLESEIAKIEADFNIERFDKALLNASSRDLSKLKQAYPFLFSRHIADSIWLLRMKDTLQKKLLTEVNTTFPNFKNEKKELQHLFRNLKYYDKTFRIPRVITLTNDVDYRNKTIVNDSLVLIALDNYLGVKHEFYQNIPTYLTANMKSSQITVNIANKYAEKYIFQSGRKTFIDKMVYYGKLLYFKDIIIPFKTDAEKIGYTEAQLKWAEANESAIWSYFVEKELLYSTDHKTPNRFIADAPFSKFYLELDNQSPGRLGQYIGWQIVRAYAKTTGYGLMKIMETDPEELFRKSKFKPKK